MPGRELDFKLYIEGIEVDFVNAQVSATANAASQMTITMVPASPIWDIRPRSLIHMFFLDDYNGPEPDGSFQSEAVWRLLWEGEAIGVRYSKSPGSRNVTLDCVDLSNYWDYTQQYFISGLKHGIPTAERQIFFGTTEVQFNILQSISFWYGEFLGGAANVSEFIVELVKKFTDKLIHWEPLNRRLKLNDKTFAIPDDQVKRLIQASQLKEILGDITGQLGGRATITSLINHIKQLIYYIHIPVIAPPFRKGSSITGNRDSTTSFLFKPNIYMTVPPRCNVIFPDQISHLNYSRSFLAEPTRLSMSASHALTARNRSELFQTHYYAPAQLREVLGLIANDPNTKKSVSVGQLNGRIFTEEELDRLEEAGKVSRERGRIPFVMTEEEFEKGIIPLPIQLPFSKYATIARDNETLKKNLQQVAEYQFQLHRYSPRSLTAQMEFNPWVVLSFPCAIFDASRSYFGNIVNITHHLDSTGGAYTQINCNLAREMVIEDDEIPFLPVWLNERYHPQNASGASGTYRELLGCDALGPNNPGSRNAILESNRRRSGDEATEQDSKADEQFDLAKVADQLFQLEKPSATNSIDPTGEYDLIALKGDTYEFAREYQRRNVATIADIFGRVYQLGVQDASVAPASVPVTDSDTELAGSTELANTVFDYRPSDDANADLITTRRKKNGRAIGNLDTPGHKRDPIIRYVKETREIRGLDGS